MSKYNKKTVRLGDVATYINGYAFKPDDWNTTGIPIIRIQDLTGSSCNPNYYQGEYNEKFLIENEDVLISWSASLGVYVWNGGKALLNQHIFKVVFDKCEIEKYYYVFSVRQKLMDMGLKSHGATMKHIVKKDFENIRIPFPPKEVQKQIAKTLMEVDRLLLMRKKQLLNLETLVKSQFIDMFGDEYHIFTKWKTALFRELFTFKSGGTPSRNIVKYFQGSIPWITSISLGDNFIGEENAVELITNEAIENSATKIIPKNSLLFGIRVGVGKSSINTAPICINQDILAIIGEEKICNLIFLKKFLERNMNFFDSQKRGATIKGIKSDVLKNFKIPLPPIELQNKFADFVRQVDKSKYRVYNSKKIINNLIKAMGT